MRCMNTDCHATPTSAPSAARALASIGAAALAARRVESRATAVRSAEPTAGGWDTRAARAATSGTSESAMGEPSKGEACEPPSIHTPRRPAG